MSSVYIYTSIYVLMCTSLVWSDRFHSYSIFRSSSVTGQESNEYEHSKPKNWGLSDGLQNLIIQRIHSQECLRKLTHLQKLKLCSAEQDDGMIINCIHRIVSSSLWLYCLTSHSSVTSNSLSHRFPALQRNKF
jgi:hypothetical protein